MAVRNKQQVKKSSIKHEKRSTCEESSQSSPQTNEHPPMDNFSEIFNGVLRWYSKNETSAIQRIQRYIQEEAIHLRTIAETEFLVSLERGDSAICIHANNIHRYGTLQLYVYQLFPLCRIVTLQTNLTMLRQMPSNNPSRSPIPFSLLPLLLLLLLLLPFLFCLFTYCVNKPTTFYQLLIALFSVPNHLFFSYLIASTLLY